MSGFQDYRDAVVKIGTADYHATDVLGGLIASIADIGGAIGAVGILLNLLQTGSLFGGNDPTQATLDTILNTIVTEYQQLNLNTQGEDLKNQLASVDNLAVTKALSIGENLASDLTANPPLSSGDKSSRLEDCLTAVNSLSPAAASGGLNQVWQVVHGYQLYFVPTNPWLYQDSGLPSANFPFTYEDLKFTSTPYTATTFDPGADPNGLVFNYIYVLPAYLRTIEVYLTVGIGFYPNFGRDAPDHAAQIRKIAADLLWVHNTIKEGIVSIAAPSEDDIIPIIIVQHGPPQITPIGDGYGGYSNWEVATGGDYHFAPPTDYSQPYGAVNLYSGYSSVGGYSGPGLPPGHQGSFPPPHSGPNAWPPPDWYLGFYGKYLLWTLARNKDVYRGIGLSVVRQVINRLKSLVGDPPLAGPSFADWSLREVLSVLGYPANHLIAARTVRSLAEYLKNSAPIMSSTPTSLRQMLEGPTPS